MGFHVPSPANVGDQSPCSVLVQSSPTGRREHEPDGRMSLLSPVELSKIHVEIDGVNTPTPLGGFSGSSPTGGEAGGTPGRMRRELTGQNSGACFVTLNREGARKLVGQSRSASIGAGAGCSFGENTTPNSDRACSNFFADAAPDDNDSDNALEADASLFAAMEPPPLPPSPPPFRRVSRSGSGRSIGSGSRSGGEGGGGEVASGGGGFSALASLEDAAQRIAVHPDLGHSYFVERSTVCDACGFCDDTCEVAWCDCCGERRTQLEETYGPLMLSPAELAAEAEAEAEAEARLMEIDQDCNAAKKEGGKEINRPQGGGGGSGGSGSCRRGSGGRVQPTLPPSLSRRYPRKSSFTLCEVRRRRLTGACWIVCQRSVYDVTAALEDHPGGKRSLLRNAGGKDCAEDFFFHSKAAKREWRQYRIGSLVACRGDGEGHGDDAGVTSMRMASDCVIS